jgi:apolipoprotein N-acyltransferase
MRQYGSVDPWSSAGILGLIGVAVGVICSAFSWAVALASKRSNAFACALAPFLWVTLEFARTHLPIIGFPWNLTGYAASESLALLQLTSLTGIYGLSFIIAAYSSLAAYAMLAHTNRGWKAMVVVTAMLVLIVSGGRYFIRGATPQYTAHLVQTNFAQSEHYSADWLNIHAGELNALERISIDAARKTPGLIIWPEVPAPFSMQEPSFAGRARRIARDSGSEFLVGVVDWKQEASGTWIATNSAVLLDPSARRIFTYDKIHLVPFGEYVPLRHWLTFAGRLTADISDFTPGSVYRVGMLPEGNFGAFICYEAIFPGEVRRFTAGGAELLINISNDGWFGRSSAPAQHLMMARVRAVENRRWLLRDTNNGFTVAVDPYGRVVARLPADTRGELDAPYSFRSDLTVYARFGDWFAWLCLIASMLGVGAAMAMRAR